MITVDTSALVAILLQEPEAELFGRLILADDSPMISVGSYMELARVMRHKRGPAALPIVDALIQKLGLILMSVTPQQAIYANEAIVAYPILNFGDGFAYGLAKDHDIPLLFKGDDFSQTDVKHVVSNLKNAF